MSIKLVIVGVSVDEMAKNFLIQDLDWMGCGSMMETLWCLKDIMMVRELKEVVPNQFEGTIEVCLEK